MEYLQDIYPLARIVYSSVLKRFDDDDYRGGEINSYMRRVCRQNPNFGYLDIRCHFEDEYLFRFSETQDYENPDVVHLSAKGKVLARNKRTAWPARYLDVKFFLCVDPYDRPDLVLKRILGIRKLESEYIRMIRYHFETLKVSKNEPNISKEEFITRRRSHNSENIQAKHFKVTNWEPAMAGEEENINTQQRPGQQYVLHLSGFKPVIPGFSLKCHLRFVTRDTDEYKPSINTAYQKERQLLLDSSFTPSSCTAKKESKWTKTHHKKPSELKSSNWGSPANESNWCKNEISESPNWGQHTKTQNASNWGKPQTEKSESPNWGQSVKSEQYDQPKQNQGNSLMPQRNKRKRTRNSESGDFDTRDSGGCTALKKTVTNIHASASAYVPTMNKG